MATPIVIGLSAVVIAIRDGEAVALAVRPREHGAASPLEGLPFGPFDPDGQRTFEIALREFVTQQTGFELGFVEQLYTFGDKGREAPLADVGAGAARVISVGYLALAPLALPTRAPGSAWSSFFNFFPWEDWRRGRPDLIDAAIAPALRAWAGRSATRLARVRLLFALEGSAWNEERVLERYELLYEAGLAPEAARDRTRALGGAPAEPAAVGLGEPMISDHRRILATGLGRLRGKLKYRPVIFELMSEAFTLSALQRTVEAISGVALHKQNFRRVVERTGFVEGLGRVDVETGGRPAELFRFRRELLTARTASGLSLPLVRD
ncbi:MAG TPA: NAD regulator [Caulobacteraceae bacterium]|nr:NAD regulator [Caulobacteraceae bacterium]